MSDTTKRLSSRAIRRLLKAKQTILEEPARANIHEGIMVYRKGRLTMPDGRSTSVEHEVIPACKTVGCIAGWLCLNAGVPRKDLTSWGVIRDTAEDLLGVHSEGLFQPEWWPRNLREAIEDTKAGTPEHAQVIAKAIDRWIAGDGSWEAQP